MIVLTPAMLAGVALSLYCGRAKRVLSSWVLGAAGVDMSKSIVIAAILLSLPCISIPAAADELSDLSARWVALGLFEAGRCSAVFPGSNPQAAKTALSKLFDTIVNKFGVAKTRSALEDELDILGSMQQQGDSWAKLCREWEKDTRLRALHPEVFSR